MIYDYAWKGGPRLLGQRGSREYVASSDEAVARRHEVQDDSDTLRGLIREYVASTAFTDLGVRIKKARLQMFADIEQEFGDMPKSALSDRHARLKFKQWREDVAQGKKPPLHPKALARARAAGVVEPKRKGSKARADQYWNLLNRLLNWALDLTYIDNNPCMRGGHLFHGNRREKIWTSEMEHRFFYGVPQRDVVAASLPLRRVYVAAVWSGQRQGDILELRGSDYDGEHLRLQQQKRRGPGWEGKRVIIKVGAPFKAILDQMELEAGVIGLSQGERQKRHIFLNARGQRWNQGSFIVQFHREVMRVGIFDRTFHDLRGTAVVRFALAGASVPQIMAITGHSLGDVKSIFETHYLHLDQALGDGAVEKRKGSAARLPSDLPTGLPTDPNRSPSVREEKATITRLLKEIEALRKRVA